MPSPETHRAVRRLRELEKRRATALLLSARGLFEEAEKTLAEREAACAALTTESSTATLDWQRSDARALVASELAAVARRERLAAARTSLREAQRNKAEVEAQLCQAQRELSEILRARTLLEDHERAARLRASRAGERRREADVQDAWPRFRDCRR